MSRATVEALGVEIGDVGNKNYDQSDKKCLYSLLSHRVTSEKE